MMWIVPITYLSPDALDQFEEMLAEEPDLDKNFTGFWEDGRTSATYLQFEDLNAAKLASNILKGKGVPTRYAHEADPDDYRPVTRKILVLYAKITREFHKD